MFNLVSIFWILRKKFRLLFLSLSCEMYVPKILMGSIETFISRGLVLLFFNEPIVTNIMSFIKALFRLRICLFPCVFCLWESSKTCYFSTVLTLLLLTMVSMSHIYCRQLACFHCVCLSHRG